MTWITVLTRSGQGRVPSVLRGSSPMEGIRDGRIGERLDSSGHRTAQSRLACRLPADAAPDGLAVTIAPED